MSATSIKLKIESLMDKGSKLIKSAYQHLDTFESQVLLPVAQKLEPYYKKLDATIVEPVKHITKPIVKKVGEVISSTFEREIEPRLTTLKVKVLQPLIDWLQTSPKSFEKLDLHYLLVVFSTFYIGWGAVLSGMLGFSALWIPFMVGFIGINKYKNSQNLIHAALALAPTQGFIWSSIYACFLLTRLDISKTQYKAILPAYLLVSCTSALTGQWFVLPLLASALRLLSSYYLVSLESGSREAWKIWACFIQYVFVALVFCLFGHKSLVISSICMAECIVYSILKDLKKETSEKPRVKKWLDVSLDSKTSPTVVDADVVDTGVSVETSHIIDAKSKIPEEDLKKKDE